MCDRKVLFIKSNLQGQQRSPVMVHSIGHIRFPVIFPLHLCVYLAPFARYCHLFRKT